MRRFAGDWIQIRTEYLETYGPPLCLNAIAGDDGIVPLDSGGAATPQTSVAAELG